MPRLARASRAATVGAGGVLGECQLPPSPADARLTRLHDGRFVWVIRHLDGRFSVLEGRHPGSTLRERQALLRAFPWLTPADALRSAPDSTVLLDASLEFSPHQSPRLLSGADHPSGTALAAEVLSGLEQIRTPDRYVAAGPLVGRVRAGKFLDVTLTRTVVPIFRLHRAAC